MNTQNMNQIRIDEEASVRFAALMADFMARCYCSHEMSPDCSNHMTLVCSNICRHANDKDGFNAFAGKANVLIALLVRGRGRHSLYHPPLANPACWRSGRTPALPYPPTGIAT